jgi:hypothetical protein
VEDIKSVVVMLVDSIVDNRDKVSVSYEETPKGYLIEVKVAEEDVGKVIGKGGRVASAIRTLAKAIGAKKGHRVMVNIFNKPVKDD